MHAEQVWEFKTRNFRVVLEIGPEEMDPADSFQYQEDIDMARSGAVEWFCATVRVFGPDGAELAGDSLGGCAYRTIREFYTAHRDPNPMHRNSSIMRAARGGRVVLCHYFPGMVAEAAREARSALIAKRYRYNAIRIRNTA